MVTHHLLKNNSVLNTFIKEIRDQSIQKDAKGLHLERKRNLIEAIYKPVLAWEQEARSHQTKHKKEV